MDWLLPAVWLGVLAGYVLARTVLPAAVTHLMALMFGVEVLAGLYAQAGPGPGLQDNVTWLALRLGAWLDIARNGGASADGLVFALAMGGLAWLLGYVSAFLVFRSGAPWLAAASNAVALLMNLSYAPPALAGSLLPFLAAVLVMVALAQLRRRGELWQAVRLPVERRVWPAAALGAVASSVVLAGFAWALPPGGSSIEVSGAFERAATPWRLAERGLDRLFASVNGSEGAQRGLNFGSSLAPRGAFDLGDAIVFEAQSSVPRYWRATTADRYTGQAMTSSETTSTSFPAGASLLAEDLLPEARTLLDAQIRIVASRSAVAFAPEAPVRVSIPTSLDARSSESAGAPDVATLRPDAPLLRGQTYTVTSAASLASVQELRAAGQQYPAWIRDRYLQLPGRRLPARVAEKTREITGEAISPYDRAVAIEAYLRTTFGYSTHVVPPPPGRDWVDYMLFDLKEAYCDYFAAAMVVMLRTQGVPARVASGFAPGDYDPQTDRWIVRENHAHSWVEVYFPLYGWVTFEPSSIRGVPQRVEAPVALPTPSAADSRAQPAVPPSASQDSQGRLPQPPDGASPDGSRPGTATWIVALGVPVLVLFLLAALVALLVRLAWQRGVAHLDAPRRPYAQLLRLVHWSTGRPPAAAQTPAEFARDLGSAIPEAAEPIGRLADAYARATYGPSAAAAEDPWPTWVAARSMITRALLRRRVSRWAPRRGRRPDHAARR